MAKIEKFAFHIPTLDELVGVLQNGLKENFADVQVSVVDCPDLTQEPFNFPVKGICGKPRIADVGGVPYLLPLVQKDKVYDLNTVAKEIQLPGAFFLGAGAVSSRVVGGNAEVIEVKANRRTGEQNFISCIRKTLEKSYSDKPVGMGGTFVIQKGKAKVHIMGFDLRLEHTHGFSHHGEGGHYHEDTTPETVEYLGYFMPAEFLFRIDRPKDTHMVGRD
ncbi:hypothetical protein JD844_033428 [Phrynosoma platyrhinos]|uniref:DUF1907 domain-containing protein n=1 Tax=Phrynosoma platyrhinos TaxID=52577 RepID=A0ABQ7T6Y7_PHRPL|nr:hypothetical protein JD844_033428 [Phrynosoma platyrhinos]